MGLNCPAFPFGLSGISFVHGAPDNPIQAMQADACPARLWAFDGDRGYFDDVGSVDGSIGVFVSLVRVIGVIHVSVSCALVMALQVASLVIISLVRSTCVVYCASVGSSCTHIVVRAGGSVLRWSMNGKGVFRALISVTAVTLLPRLGRCDQKPIVSALPLICTQGILATQVRKRIVWCCFICVISAVILYPLSVTSPINGPDGTVCCGGLLMGLTLAALLCSTCVRV